ncbi:MAG: glycosyltransferase family 2 protein [Bdellovibrionaceae bacterium]|nr:glycosyltransferase family 2 protein [Pseudobdellovibrionaceae bacterium]
MSLDKLPISLVVITLNEEKNIRACIESAPFVSDIVILDSFSKDKTKEIAISLGARVFDQSWLGFGPQKNKATELATYDWVLSLDADECVSPELHAEIRQKFASLNSTTGYLMPRKSFYLGRWIMHGGWYPDYQLRLFHRQNSGWNQGEIHEKVESLKTEKFQSCIQHYVFTSISHQVITNDKYSSLQAKQMHENKSAAFSLFRLLVKPPVKFFENYIFKRGFMDGLPGFIIAVGSAYSVFLKHAKLWELKK